MKSSVLNDRLKNRKIQPECEFTMSDTPKYNFPNAQKVQIFEHVDTYIENNHTLSTEDQTAISELKQVIQDLQTRYPMTEPTQQTAIIEAEFEEIKQKQPWKWKNLLNAGRLLNGGKAALTKAGEHLFEENIWGKAAIGFLEGVTENIE